jgi:hypothetical protein
MLSIDSHAISVLDGRETVGDSNGGATFGSFVESFLYYFFRVRIKGRCSFIEQEDFGVPKQCASDCYTLWMMISAHKERFLAWEVHTFLTP